MRCSLHLICAIAFAGMVSSFGWPGHAFAAEELTAQQFLALCYPAKSITQLNPRCRAEVVAGLQAARQLRLACPGQVDIDVPGMGVIEEMHQLLGTHPELGKKSDSDLELWAITSLWPCPKAKGQNSPALVDAAEKGDLGTVENLLAKGANPNSHSRQGTALTSAAASGHFPVVQALVERGADVNAVNGSGSTPLILATCSPEMTTYLVQHGASIDQTDGRGWTALGYSVFARNYRQRNGGDLTPCESSERTLRAQDATRLADLTKHTLWEKRTVDFVKRVLAARTGDFASVMDEPMRGSTGDDVGQWYTKEIEIVYPSAAYHITYKKSERYFRCLIDPMSESDADAMFGMLVSALKAQLGSEWTWSTCSECPNAAIRMTAVAPDRSSAVSVDETRNRRDVEFRVYSKGLPW